jgi:hypothetical protein
VGEATRLRGASDSGGVGFDKLQNIFCEPPAAQRIGGDYLMKQYDNPELNLVRDLGYLMLKRSLR